MTPPPRLVPDRPSDAALQAAFLTVGAANLNEAQRTALSELFIATHAPAPVLAAAPPAEAPAERDVRALVDRFLGWPLPKTFAPDCGISFDGRKYDEWNKGKTWPVGTNLFTATEAEAMFRHALAAAPAGECNCSDAEKAHGHHFGCAAPAAPAEGWAPPLQGDDSAPWPTFPLDTHYNTRVSMRYGQFCNLILATAPRVTGGREDSARMDFIESTDAVLYISVGGERALSFDDSSQAAHFGATYRDAIDAALQAATGGKVES